MLPKSYRKDNDKGYSPDNCRWATYTEQGNNKRTKAEKQSLIRGISWSKQQRKWTARKGQGNDRIWLGSFNTENEAIQALNRSKCAVKL